MMRFLLFALMRCLYWHGLSMGFKIGTHLRKIDGEVHIIVHPKDIFWIIVMLGCSALTACVIHL